MGNLSSACSVENCPGSGRFHDDDDDDGVSSSSSGGGAPHAVGVELVEVELVCRCPGTPVRRGMMFCPACSKPTGLNSHVPYRRVLVPAHALITILSIGMIKSSCKRNAYHTLKFKNPVFATVLICYGGVADLARLSTAERKRLGARGAFADVAKQSRLMAAKARETEFSQAQALARKVTAVEHVDDDDDDDAETAKGRGGAPESFDAIVPLRTWGSPLSQSRMLHPVEGKTQARN